MVVIDQWGFRLIAMALLPIGPSTLLYGSADGGNTVHNDDPQLNDMMQKIGAELNLRPHKVGVNSPSSCTLHTAGDVEVHRGRDGRYYCVDFARGYSGALLG